MSERLHDVTPGDTVIPITVTSVFEVVHEVKNTIPETIPDVDLLLSEYLALGDDESDEMIMLRLATVSMHSRILVGFGRLCASIPDERGEAYLDRLRRLVSHLGIDTRYWNICTTVVGGKIKSIRIST